MSLFLFFFFLLSFLFFTYLKGMIHDTSELKLYPILADQLPNFGLESSSELKTENNGEFLRQRHLLFTLGFRIPLICICRDSTGGLSPPGRT